MEDEVARPSVPIQSYIAPCCQIPGVEVEEGRGCAALTVKDEGKRKVVCGVLSVIESEWEQVTRRKSLI